VPELVEESELVATNTLAGVTYSAMFVLGSAIGGAVAALFGVETALLIDAASFGLSALLSWRIARLAAGVARSGRGSSGWRDLVDGLRFTRRQPDIGPVVLVKGFGQLGSVDVIAATLAAGAFSLGGGSEGGALGLMLAAMGIGTILGPPVGNKFHQGASPALRWGIAAGYAAIALSWLLIGMSPWLGLTLVAFVIRGVGGSLNWVYSDVLIQRHVPNEFRGRVFSLNLAFFMLVVSLSTLATGFLLDQAGASPWQVSLWVGVLSMGPLAYWLLRGRRAQAVPAVYRT
jgi:hypothetical protein